MGVLERSYKDKITHWKHGGIVGVLGYGSGIIGRYVDLPDEFPGVEHFHTVRVNQPAGWFYTTKALRELCEIWDRARQQPSERARLHRRHDLPGHHHRSAGALPSPKLTAKGWDLGGSGSAMRTPSCCVGQARCEWACYDTMDLCYESTQHFQFEMHRPSFPYKFKIKCSGCPNDCVAAVARADMSVIGVWKDDIRIDQAAVKAYAGGELKPRGRRHPLCQTGHQGRRHRSLPHRLHEL